MGRSVVLAGAARCPRCSLPPRLCVCDLLPPVETRLGVHVLIHKRERHKPSSTGLLVARSVRGARTHVYERVSRHFPATGLPADAVAAGRELWILHPCGELLPAPGDAASLAGGNPPDITPPDITPPEIVLIDGTWRQAGEMLRSLDGRGRCVALPRAADAPSRFWLRAQAGPGRLSTAEALLGVLAATGEHGAARLLRLHFELHVYATLLARGQRESAERYLGESPLRDEPSATLGRLHAR